VDFAPLLNPFQVCSFDHTNLNQNNYLFVIDCEAYNWLLKATARSSKLFLTVGVTALKTLK
jgi:hypothetical protein